MNELQLSYDSEFAVDRVQLFEHLRDTISWDERMQARKTASFGRPYNYSGLTYPERAMPRQLSELAVRLNDAVGMRANNCLLNYYPDGNATMGFHSDAVDHLQPGTGIAIVSLGSERTLTFRATRDKSNTREMVLEAGSLLFMPSTMQSEWQHAMLRDPEAGGRISLTFREISETSAKTKS